MVPLEKKRKVLDILVRGRFNYNQYILLTFFCSIVLYLLIYILDNRPKLGFKSLYPSRTNSIPKSKKSKHVKDALKKHCKQKHKLDAIEEASVEMMSSSAAVTYNFGMEKDDENICDKETSNMTEMHTIDEVNGVIHDRPCGSSSTNSGNETTTSNSSEGASDSLENVFQQYRSTSLPVPTKPKVIKLELH